ncbi:MAG TPA: hypothetical protein DCY94_01600 [Firmicutes bacterium]|nr:hypothetical protein [Bacillota bacterium]
MNKIRPLIEDKNLDGAQAFLDMFGLTIVDAEYFDERGVAYIEKDGNNAGFLAKAENKITISANTDLGILEASFQPVEDRFKDSDFRKRNRILQDYQLRINYILYKSEAERIAGTHILDCEKRGIEEFRCFAHHDLTYTVNGSEKFSLVFLESGKTFMAKFPEGDDTETIEIAPFNDLNGYLRHDVKKGKYDKKLGYRYRKYAGVFPKNGYQSKMLHVFKKTSEIGQELELVNDFCENEGFQDNSSGSAINIRKFILQLSKLMHELDPDMFTKIQEIRALLEMNGASLLDELITACLVSYGDEVVEALFGYVPKLEEEPIKPLVILPKDNKIHIAF